MNNKSNVFVYLLFTIGQFWFMVYFITDNKYPAIVGLIFIIAFSVLVLWDNGYDS